MKKVVLFYQKYISPLKPACCRFYPTCSNYALWQAGRNGFFKTFFSTFWRILRCNPLHHGGIDYPKTQIDIKKFKFISTTITIYFWFVPDKDDFYLIKGL